jgi:V/A-type H+-transporting ATPase subunit A
MENNNLGKIVKISGPLVVVSNFANSKVYDVCLVGNKKLLGEIIELRGEFASVQVYEETAGLKVGEPVVMTNEPLTVWLAPGLLTNIFDGIERPLTSIYNSYGNNIPLGVEIDKLDTKKLWNFIPTIKVGDSVSASTIIGYVDETSTIKHKVMIPYKNKSGVVSKIYSGEKTIIDTVIEYTTSDGEVISVSMLSKWPVRIYRPYKQKLGPTVPMVTGQRVIDALFPITLGGVAAVPGPFGSGKTVVQHQLAKWSNVDIIVYVGCGERGNEMTDVLLEFPTLIDPYTNKSLMERTVLIANTSNMPVAAREASIYTGITIAEYYRDMGYKVAIMADSTSRWAEALREMSSRLEEMPGEEGYPAYLSSRLAEFYERAGLVETLSNTVGSVTAIGAISPAGGDTSEPVSQGTLRIVKVFWNLSASLAYKRHFPAIDWLKSYSLYSGEVFAYNNNHISYEYSSLVKNFLYLLQEEQQLLEIVRLVGMDSLSLLNRIKLLTSQMIREDFLHQNAFDKVDSFSSTQKQFLLMKLISKFLDKSLESLDRIKKISFYENLESKYLISRFKYCVETNINSEYDQIISVLDKEFEVGE